MATLRTTYRLPSTGTHTNNANLILRALAAAPERATASPPDMRDRVVTVRLLGTGTADSIAHSGTSSYRATPKVIGAHGKALPASGYLRDTELGPAPWGLGADGSLNPILLARWLQALAELLQLASIFAHYRECVGSRS